MLCFICGRICDVTPSGLCVECTREVNANNEKVHLLTLLNEALEFCPVYLRERIEAVLYKVPKESDYDPKKYSDYSDKTI